MAHMTLTTGATTGAVARPAPSTRLRSRTRLVVLPGSGALPELLHGCPASLVYSNAEQRLSGQRGDLTGWAGRLAVKLAVADLLGLDGAAALPERRDVGLAQLEVLPARTACPDGPGCLGPHPPTLHLGSPFAQVDGQWQVSISHTRSRALALVARYSDPVETVRYSERSVQNP